MPEFKYSAEIKSLNLKMDCPPPLLVGRETLVFRFSFEDIKHPDTFKPQYCKRPPRKLPLDENKNCDGYGLSLFETIEQSIIFFNNILDQRFRTLLGYTHISNGQLNTTDGVTTTTDEHGHFNLHEFEGVDLISKFSVLLPIPAK